MGWAFRGSLSWGERAYRRIARINPLVYLSIYLALIPIFGALYRYGPDQVFYAPYAKFERGATGDVYRFEGEILDGINRTIARTPKRPGEWNVEEGSVRVGLRPESEPEKLRIAIIANLSKIGPKGRMQIGNWRYETVIALEPVLITAEPYQVCRELAAPPPNQLLEGEEQRILETLFHGSPPCDRGLFLVFDRDQEERLFALLAGFMGDAHRFSGSYSRMLYFSAITITTVGFGDIVPITPQARLLTAIEAILGWVLSGLFLAAVAWRIGRVVASEAEKDRIATHSPEAN